MLCFLHSNTVRFSSVNENTIQQRCNKKKHSAVTHKPRALNNINHSVRRIYSYNNHVRNGIAVDGIPYMLHNAAETCEKLTAVDRFLRSGLITYIDHDIGCVSSEVNILWVTAIETRIHVEVLPGLCLCCCHSTNLTVAKLDVKLIL